MAQITSNTFTINVNRATDTPTVTTKTVTSNTFTVNVNRSTNTEDELTTKVLIYKGVNELTAVNRTPGNGEYQVTITGTKNCTAKLKSDNKTIRLLSVSSSAGQINIAINVENVKTYNKTISVASIISNEIVHESIVKQSQLEQNLDGFKTTVSATYQTKDAMSNYSTTSAMNSAINQKANEITTSVSETYATNGSVDSKVSEVSQKADKINWLVASGTNKSDMTLTPELFNLVSNNITLTADHINLNGYVSNEDANWSIDTQGNMESKNMNIEGDLSADTITCNALNSPKYPGTLDGDIELYVNSSTGNDDNVLGDNVVYATLQGAINAIPKFLNGKTVHITLEANTTEDVYIKGVVGGSLRIYMNGKTLYGTIRTYVCSAAVYVYGGTKDNTEGATSIIHPNVGLSFGTRSASIGFEASQYGALYNVKVFAPDNNPSGVTSTDKVCVASQAGTGSVYCKNVEIVNAVIGFRANNMGCMHVSKSSGKAGKCGFEAVTGGQISIANNNQAGGAITNTNKSSGGQIWFDDGKPIFDSSDASTDPVTAPVVSGTKTITIKSSYGDTYRSTVYNNWKKDGTVRQGDYGYGDCTGLWFFGSAFSGLKGKTINKVQITINRQSGGSYAAVGLVVRTHNYSARPSGAPALSSDSYGTLSIPTGTSGTLTITNSDVLNGIKNGTVKGFGIRTTYDASHYAVCSGSVTVKITYTE